ncbi:substrate-binding periplasmic protein [Brucella gallinifaecis]|uniref:Transporter substrate-binding domain-containing protein n=1 Tax=Brucella gallinifaecis TaxID=215590 RepID=A0A502BRX9_9HYPH|nr:transporter substrate-binding domain-containing protein [Brucella gallinifaecis]TPF76975.1 transporter substrate-binding domain-containing protein [Brucella gallinifaecis]
MRRNYLYALLVVFATVACIQAKASGFLLSESQQLRIGVAYVTPEPRSTEFRVYTEDGFEQEIGRELARSLGLQPIFVQVTPSGRKELLEKGGVDVIVERKATDNLIKEKNIIEAGFRSPLSVAMRSDTNIRTWDDLAGRVVCVSEAGFNEQRIATHHGAILKIQRAPALSLMLVRTGECDAALHDAELLAMLFADRNWHKFSATLPPVETSSLVVEVAENPELQVKVQSALALLAREELWQARRARWARNVSFEVYLEQDAPDCH